MKKILAIALLAIIALASICCRESRVIPRKPDYRDSTQWYISDRSAAADIFYIISTETGDWVLPDGKTICHFADTYSDSLRQPLLGEMSGVDRLVAGNLNYYSPYYRQCSLQCFMDESTLDERMAVSTADVRRAFRHYLREFNDGRPFILAGFSQGAMIMMDLLEEMDDDTYSRMIAAYAIGISIPQSEVDASSRIVPAGGPDDTGVTICYNSVESPEDAMWESSAVAINPVNWTTDATDATLITEPTPNMPVEEQAKDTLSVHLDTASGMLVVEGYTATDYVLPLIGREGNYHSREIWLYRESLRENMALRAAKFLEQAR